MKKFAYTRPATLAAARDRIGPGALPYAGGMDLLDRMKERLDTPERLVDLKAGALDGRIETVGDGRRLRLGALATLAEVAAHPTVRERFGAFATACGEAATPQVRNVATLGGNLLQQVRCWYYRSRLHPCARKGGAECMAMDDAGENRYHSIFLEGPCVAVHPSNAAAPLVAFDATVDVLPAGEDEPQTRPITELFTTDGRRAAAIDPGDLVTAFHLPLDRRVRSAYLEAREKQTFDWALVSVAVGLQVAGGKVTEGRIVLGHVAPTPRRATEAEKAIAGKAVTEATARAAGDAALAGAEPLSDNAYKMPIVRALVARALRAAAKEGE